MRTGLSHAAARMRPPVPGQGSSSETFKWMHDTLPRESVIAANWDYGTQLNVLGGVRTVVDSDHFLPHWIHLYYRHVFSAQDAREALEFLKTHQRHASDANRARCDYPAPRRLLKHG